MTYTSRICEVTYDVAAPFIRKFHYSGTVPKGRNIYFACYLDDELYAITNYGGGINPFQASYLSRVLSNPDIRDDSLVELKRLCRSEPRHEKYQLTHFLSRCHKLLKSIYNIRHVISFSDPGFKHNGGIYIASNFKHIGQTGTEMHVVDKDGNPVHRRVAYRYSRRYGCTIGEARDILGFTPIKTPRKDRWYLSIG